MTKILKIVLHGFKSFARRTEILFSENFNVIIGPNGAGKSNVLDALCFVLGRSSSKELRAEKTANLVYNGGKTSTAAKYAEVSIFFDNSKKEFPIDSDVISITRIVRNDGKGIYKINDNVSTRRDIIELLGSVSVNADGYNIILQGDITQIVEMSSVERRKLIEEISGISIYEEKKEKALRELEKVEKALTEGEFVLKERKNYLNELKQERDNAKEYLDLKETLNISKASLIYSKLKKIEKDKISAEEKIKENEKEIETLLKKVEELKTEKEEYNNKIKEINSQINQRGEKDQLDLHKEVEELKVEISNKKNTIQNNIEGIKRIDERNKELEKSVEELTSKIDLNQKKLKELEEEKESINSQIINIDKSLDEFKEKYNLDNIFEIEKKIEEIEKKAEESETEINKLRTTQQELIRKIDRCNFELENTRSKQIEIKKKIEENRKNSKKLEELKDEFKNTTLTLNKNLSLDSKYASELNNARKKRISHQEEYSKYKAKEQVANSIKSSNNVLKYISQIKNQVKGIFGTVGEIGSADSKYSQALEVCAGSRINGIVVDDENTASNIIRTLKEKRIGVGFFFPLTKIKTLNLNFPTSITNTQGVLGFAKDLISYDPKFENIFNFVFGNTVVVEDLEVAKRIGVGKIRMVTLDGDLVETSGAMQGGHRNAKSHGSFKQTDISSKISILEKTLSDIDLLIADIEESRLKNEEEIQELRNKKAELEGEIITLEKVLSSSEIKHESQDDVEKNKEELEEELNTLQMTISSKMRTIATFKIEKQKLKESLLKSKEPKILAQLNAYQDSKSNLKGSLVGIEKEYSLIENQIKNIYLLEKEKTQKIINDTKKEKITLTKLNEELQNELTDDTELLKQKEIDQKQFYEQFKELFAKRDEYNKVISEIDSNIVSNEEKARTLEKKNNSISLDSAEVRAKYLTLTEQLSELNVSEEKIIDDSEKKLTQECSKIEEKITELGNVNLRALDIYESVNNEYEELIEKKDELQHEREDVLNLMNEIETKKLEAFMITYNQINEEFQKIFSKLTEKGESTLLLEDENNVFENGVRINVKITSKKFLDIRSLSGGEKTMTAVAFIFAIQETQPAPFYILDEVDAALDKRNAEKLGKLLKEYGSQSQYVVISHNDAVLTQGDSVFGVSMDKQGVSKILSIKLDN